jgi:hypothetical protein
VAVLFTTQPGFGSSCFYISLLFLGLHASYCLQIGSTCLVLPYYLIGYIHNEDKNFETFLMRYYVANGVKGPQNERQL